MSFRGRTELGRYFIGGFHSKQRAFGSYSLIFSGKLASVSFRRLKQRSDFHVSGSC